MDPIHPIVPTAPRIPPVAPPPGVTPTDRQVERRRQEAEGERRRRRKQQQSRARYEDPDGYDSVADDDDAGEDDGRPHIDVTV
jgi:hypothetical protein